MSELGIGYIGFEKSRVRIEMKKILFPEEIATLHDTSKRLFIRIKELVTVGAVA